MGFASAAAAPSELVARPLNLTLGSMVSRSASIQAGVGFANISPHGFRRWAQHYLKCRCDFVAPDAFSPVPYFLLCRAIELELKARHLEILRTSEVKDRFGHNLIKAYRALPTDQQQLSLVETEMLEHASSVYRTKGFEYFSVHDAGTAFKRFPDLETLDRIAARLVSMLPNKSLERGRDG